MHRAEDIRPSSPYTSALDEFINNMTACEALLDLSNYREMVVDPNLNKRKMTEEISVPGNVSSDLATTLKSEPEPRPPSPEPNCAICLEDFNNKSYTNSCFHEFCFLCLREWSKIKPECPLCKQRFHTIIYNVRSQNDFDSYEVFDHPSQLERAQRVLLNLAFHHNHPYANAMDYREQQRRFEPYRPSALLTLPGAFDTNRTVLYLRSSLNAHLEQDLSQRGQTYRRDIYRHNRWVRPTSVLRIRESSPEFYRLNPATTHRLVPWLTRELHVLLDVSIDPNSLVQDVMNLITQYPIRSRQFRDALTPALGDRADHFIHEFYHFATSPHDMESYDVMAEYSHPDLTPWGPNYNVVSSDESDSDIEVVTIVKSQSQNNQTRIKNEDHAVLDLTNRPGPSGSQRMTNGVIEISETSSDSEVEIIHFPPPKPKKESPTRGPTIIEDNDSDSEVEIIHVPPPKPIVITIESTDSENEEAAGRMRNSNSPELILPDSLPSSSHNNNNNNGGIESSSIRNNMAKIDSLDFTKIDNAKLRDSLEKTFEIMNGLSEVINTTLLQTKSQSRSRHRRHSEESYLSSSPPSLISLNSSGFSSSSFSSGSSSSSSSSSSRSSHSNPTSSMSSSTSVSCITQSSDSDCSDRRLSHKNKKRKKNSSPKESKSKRRKRKSSIKKDLDTSDEEDCRPVKRRVRVLKPKLRSVVKKVEPRSECRCPLLKHQPNCPKYQLRLRIPRNTRYSFPTESD